MPKLTSGTLEKFLEKLGSSAPVPGGGAAAALVLAEAAALAEMVARINLKRAEREGCQNLESRKNISRLARLRRQLLCLLEEDAEIFSVLSKFKKEDRQKSSYQKTLRNAANIPCQMCVMAGQGLEWAVSEKDRTGRWLYSDLLESLILFEAGFKAARLNVEINLVSMADSSFSESTKRKLDRVARRMRERNKG